MVCGITHKYQFSCSFKICWLIYALTALNLYRIICYMASSTTIHLLRVNGTNVAALLTIYHHQHDKWGWTNNGCSSLLACTLEKTLRRPKLGWRANYSGNQFYDDTWMILTSILMSVIVTSFTGTLNSISSGTIRRTFVEDVNEEWQGWISGNTGRTIAKIASSGH